jgi:predicted Rdx family selenoprotein
MTNKFPVIWVDEETLLFWIQKKDGIEEAPRQIQDQLRRVIRLERDFT